MKHHQYPDLPFELTFYSWRPAQKGDATALHALYLAADEADNRHWAGVVSDVELELQDPNLNLEQDTIVALDPDGTVAAVAWIYAPPNAESKDRAFVWPDIHPQHRTKAMQDYLLAWGAARGEEILRARSKALPKILRGGAMSHDQGRIDWFQRAGYQIVRYFFMMRRDLKDPIGDVQLPSGLRILPWQEEYSQRTFEAFNESFRDHWGFEPTDKVTWDMFFVGRESFRPDLSFVVLDGEEVAGFTINFYSPEENARIGLNQAWVGDLGVRRPWRRQGVATALLNLSMRAFAAAGIEFACLGVDSENPTGALGVYERVGFSPYESSVGLMKPLTGWEHLVTEMAVAVEV